MRFTRTALTAATALLTLTGLGTTAHADGYNTDSGKGKPCFISVVGHHNTSACGSITYGDNATTGQNHSVGLPQVQDFGPIAVTNNAGFDLVLASLSGPISGTPDTPIPVGAQNMPVYRVNGLGNGQATITSDNGTYEATISTSYFGGIAGPSTSCQAEGNIRCSVNGNLVVFSPA
ncbi:hypothetical protein ABZ490_26660 [Streptomyces sp. NPDC005811]|uniref:hypothetical protein n=1 Tax=Streptomyces sp. NPDC005811 TaxID=3154565 RepID=UPI00340772B9